MATLIKETPILKGHDALNFLTEMKKSNTRKVSSEVKKRMLCNFNIINSLI